MSLALTALDQRKNRIRLRRELENRRRQQQQQQQELSNSDVVGDDQHPHGGLNANLGEGGDKNENHIQLVENEEEYYEITQNSATADLTLMIRLFAWKSKAISKDRETQWRIIEKDVVPGLTKMSVDHKEQKLRRMVLEIEQELTNWAN